MNLNPPPNITAFSQDWRNWLFRLWENTRSDIQIVLSSYDAQPARAAESNIHGGLLSLANGQPLNSVPTNIVISKGIGKILIVINAGSDVSGSILVTGTSVDRNTGATTGADTETLIIDALTTDASTTDANGNTRHAFTGAYITSKWFVNSVTLSTTDLTLTDVDVYHVSFEQFNDSGNWEIDTFDMNVLTSNVSAEIDVYAYYLAVQGDKCDIGELSDVHVGADGETAIANQYWRLRRSNLGKKISAASDGVWIDAHYSSSPSWVEDATIKLWAKRA